MVRHTMPIMLLSLALTLLMAGSVSAHAELKSATPAPDSTVTSVPDKVVIVFTEELEANGSLIRVTDASGASVDQGDTTRDTSDPQRATLSVSLRSGLGNGAYTVTWKNASADGHAEEGSYSFKVNAAAPTTDAPATALPATGAANGVPLLFWLIAALLVGATGVALRRAAARRG